VEYPSAKFARVRDAIVEAVRLVRSYGGRSAVFVGQGQGARDDSIRAAEMRLIGDALEFGEPVRSLPLLVAMARIDSSLSKVSHDARSVRLSGASPEMIARLADTVFRDHFRIRPFNGASDYAFGAEWVVDERPTAKAQAQGAQVIDLASRRRK
jgi:hypothetical protein